MTTILIFLWKKMKQGGAELCQAQVKLVLENQTVASPPTSQLS